ncbi:MAG: methionine synthase [Candidatus Thermoplasmatota archaeon]|nr:methionine synthase [Candidatus Thermoplasmatota archaeon]
MAAKELILQEIGSFRKPEYLSKNFHQIEGSQEFIRLAERATTETLEVFRKAGLENLGVGGEMFRWEMYEALAENIGNLEFYGMVRSFDNRYYRKGSVTGPVERKRPFHKDELHYLLNTTHDTLKLPITGPYTMMDWSFNEYYKDRRELANAYADAINTEIRELKSLWDKYRPGEKFEVQIDEPAATTHPSEMDIVVESVNRSIEGISGIEPSIHVCYSIDYAYLYNTMPDLKVDGLNLEFANRDLLTTGRGSDMRPGFSDLRKFREINDTLSRKKFIGVGVTDVHIDTIESPELIRDRVLTAIDLVGEPSLIRVNPDCGLRTRSREVGYQKLKNMSDAVIEVRKDL